MRSCPVQFDPARKVWTVSQYSDVLQVMRDVDAFAAPGTLLGGAEPTHSRIRRIVTPSFSTARVRIFEPLVLSTALELTEEIAARCQCEFVGEFAYPIALSVIAAMLGVERSRIRDLQRWAGAILHCENPLLPEDDRRRYREQVAECHAFLTRHIADLPGRPRDPYIAPFLTGTDDRDGLSTAEQVAVALFLVVAGSESTTSLIGLAMLMLATEPVWRKALCDDSELIPAFLEEVLRFHAPVQRTLRQTTCSALIGAIEVPEDAALELVISAANRDRVRFLDADLFRIDRDPNEHLSFASGRRLCLGAQLARIEASTALRIFLKRFPEAVLSRPDEPIDFGASHFIKGPARLNLCWAGLPLRRDSHWEG